MINRLSFVLLSLVFIAANCDTDSKRYLRIYGESLQAASKSFVASNGSGPKITLLSALHISEPGYYKEIQRRLNAADVVLYEFASDPADFLEQQRRGLQVEISPFLVRGAKALGLSLQLRSIDYTQPHFVHADTTVSPINDISDLFNSSAVSAESNPNSTLETVLQKAEQMGATSARNFIALIMVKLLDPSRDAPSAKDQSIIFSRNDIVLERLRENLVGLSDGQEIVIFYGAGHMQDLEASLVKMGYRLNSTDWLQAFSL